MSGVEFPPGWEVPLSTSTMQLIGFVGVQTKLLSGLGGGLIERAHDFARHRLLEKRLHIPGLALCQTVIYKRVEELSGAEQGGGLQFNFQNPDELIGAYIVGARVCAYHLNDSLVEADDPFSVDQAEEVARCVEKAPSRFKNSGLVVAPDLSYLRGEDVPIIIETAYQAS